jgi:hypothetical protein
MEAAAPGQPHFPRPAPGSLTGVQPKLSVRFVQGSYSPSG